MPQPVDEPDDPLTQQTGLDAAERRMRAQIAVDVRMSMCDDRAAVTAPARKAFLDQFEREVDPDGVLLPDERARRATLARRAYMRRLALKSAKVRRIRKMKGRRDQAAEIEREPDSDDGGSAA
jgi:hypothetical protein